MIRHRHFVNENENENERTQELTNKVVDCIIAINDANDTIDETMMLSNAKCMKMKKIRLLNKLRTRNKYYRVEALALMLRAEVFFLSTNSKSDRSLLVTLLYYSQRIRNSNCSFNNDEKKISWKKNMILIELR